MMTIKQLIERFIDGDDDIGIFCHDPIQRQDVIR